MFVVRRKGSKKFLRFAAHKVAKEVGEIYKADLYSRKVDALKRAGKYHWMDEGRVDAGDFEVCEIEVKCKIIKAGIK